jgi:hypothetical protein
MTNTANNTQNQQQKAAQQPRRPNESGTISVEAHMKIFDPNTQKVYVEGRA